MRNFTFIILTTLVSQVFGQQVGIYQLDSIYKANKVKARLRYSGQDKELIVITYYDQEGRLKRYCPEPLVEGTRVTTYYSYDSNGHAIGMVDTIRSIEPDPENDKKSIEISNYELQFDSGVLVKLTKYNADGSIDYVSKFSNNREVENVYRYRNGVIIESYTTEYQAKLSEERFYGWKKSSGRKSVWDYRFKYQFENDRVKSYVWFDRKKKKETVKFLYDEKGLLLKIDGHTPDFFEYIYY